ncbi:heme utilization protein HutZ [Thiomicrorhabdus hydrogeniphila]
MSDKYEESQNQRIGHEFLKYVTSKQSLMLATVNDQGIPDVSYAPFVVDESFNVYVFISEIVERTRNLISNGKGSLLFIEDEQDAKHIFARRRATMQAKAQLLTPEEAKTPTLKTMFEEKFGDFINLELAGKSDFHLIKLVPYEGGLTKGFGLAFKLTGPKLCEVEHLKKGHSNRNSEVKENGAA